MTLPLDHVTFKDGPDTHIQDVSLTLVRGRLHVLLGPTLSGKATLMRLMAGPALLTAHGRHPTPAALLDPPDGHYRIGFHADNVRIGTATAGALAFDAVVSVNEINRSESFVHARIGDATWVCLAPGVEDRLPGKRVQVQVDMTAAFVFDPAGLMAQPFPLARAV